MKRKLFAVCMVLALMLTCLFAVPTQAANEVSMVAKGNRTILNYDFSDGAEGWDVPASGYGGIVEEDGNKYAQITKRAAFTSPSILVKPGEYIAFEFDYKNNMSFRPYIRFYDVNGNWDQAMQGVDYPGQKADWTRYQSKGIKVPEGKVRASVTIDVYASAYNTAVGSGAEFIHCSFDNVIIAWNPTLEEAVYNGDMEIVQDNMPKGYTASGDNVTIERVMTHSGKTAIKITNTADTTSYVSAPVYAQTTGGSGSGVVGTDFSAWMNLTDFEDDAADAEDGVRLELYYGGALKNNTGWFTKVKDADNNDMGWRKMMICWDYVRNTGSFELRVTLNGKGTVYVDDFDTHAADFIRNGDFEGFSDENKPAGWEKANTALTWGNEIAIAREADTGNHYLKLTNVGQSAVTQVGNFVPLYIIGDRYKLSMDIKSGAGGTYGVIATASGSFSYNSGGGLGDTGGSGTVWLKDFTYYITAPRAQDTLNLYCRWASATGSQCFDNISIEPVICETAFYDAEGNKVTQAEAGKAYTAKYVGYAKNYPTTTGVESAPVSLVYALYEKLEDGSVRLASVQIKKGTGQYIGTQIGKAPSIKVQGAPPLELTSDSAITIPNDGKTYELRAYTWDDFVNMTPYYASISA